jgi:hypothetical protein
MERYETSKSGRAGRYVENGVEDAYCREIVINRRCMMTKREKIETAVKNAVEAQIRDDLCARSTLYGLATVFEFIPGEMVTAAASLSGGCGSASGSCGAYCCGLLAVGLRHNATMDEEREDPSSFERTASHFTEYRDRFKSVYGTVLCPEIHKRLFGRSYILDDQDDVAEFLALPGHQVKCSKVVAAATRIAAEMILEDG